MLDKNIDVRTVIVVEDDKQFKLVHIRPSDTDDQMIVDKETI